MWVSIKITATEGIKINSAVQVHCPVQTGDFTLNSDFLYNNYRISSSVQLNKLVNNTFS